MSCLATLYGDGEWEEDKKEEKNKGSKLQKVYSLVQQISYHTMLKMFKYVRNEKKKKLFCNGTVVEFKSPSSCITVCSIQHCVRSNSTVRTPDTLKDRHIRDATMLKKKKKRIFRYSFSN